MGDCAEGRIHSSSLMGTTPVCSSIEGGVLPYTQRETPWHFPLPFSSHNLKAYVGTRLNPWTVLPNSKFRPFGNVPFKKWNVLLCDAGGTQRGDITHLRCTMSPQWWVKRSCRVTGSCSSSAPHREPHLPLASKRPPKKWNKRKKGLGLGK